MVVGSLLSDFDFIPDKQGLFLDVKYPEEEKPRYTIDLIGWTCTCTGHTMECSRVKKDKSYKPKNCKHLEEVVFRIRHAGIKFGRFVLQEALP